MSIWVNEGIENKVISILKNIKSDHHFGTPFVTAYQLAALFKSNYPTSTISNLKIGGKKSKAGFSLAKYLALQMSIHIKYHGMQNVEGALISNEYLSDIVIKYNNGNNSNYIHSSIGNANELSLFRYKEGYMNNIKEDFTIELTEEELDIIAGAIQPTKTQLNILRERFKFDIDIIDALEGTEPVD